MSFAHHYANPRLPVWYRVCLYAVDHDGIDLDRGELLRAVDPEQLVRPAEISRAIKHGISKGMLKPGSCSSMLLFARESADPAENVKSDDQGTEIVRTPGKDDAA